MDSQEEFLSKENKKHVKVKNAYAQEVEKNENLTKDLSIFHDTISNLRTESASLIAMVEKLNACNDSIASLRTENDNLVSKIKELNVCNDSISCLRNENAILHTKIDELNVCKLLSMFPFALDAEILMLKLLMITLLLLNNKMII